MRKKSDKFKWMLGQPAPLLKSHSFAKLNIVEDYLSKYFETVAPNPGQDKITISLVDGFCGGGLYTYNGNSQYGSPILMLKAVENAVTKQNSIRKKTFYIHAKFYFVDTDKNALDFLKNEIIQLGWGNKIGEDIFLIHAPFEKKLTNIVSQIKQGLGKGRSIFLLDQFGWGKVSFQNIRFILDTLPKSEIILTFAVDWLIDHLKDKADFYASLAPIELHKNDVLEYLEIKKQPGGKLLVQKLLSKHMQQNTGARFFTPFFLHSSEAHRDLWLVHLSKHPTARNVMVSSHWDLKNASRHHGEAGLNMLGFKENILETKIRTFDFNDSDKEQTLKSIQEDLPHAVSSCSFDDEGITIEAFLGINSNNTPASISILHEAFKLSVTNNEIEIITPTSRPKDPNAKLLMTDRLRIPLQGEMFPGVKLK